MKKFLHISILIVFVLMSVFLPYQTKNVDASTSAALKVVKGTVGERVIAGIGEKVGVNFLTKTAREKAVQRWNLELHEKIKYYDQLGETFKADEYRNFQQLLSQKTTADIIPLPEKPGFGKVVVTSALFLTGLDVVVDVANSISNANATQTKLDYLTDASSGVASGIYFTKNSGFEISSNGSSLFIHFNGNQVWTACCNQHTAYFTNSNDFINPTLSNGNYVFYLAYRSYYTSGTIKNLIATISVPSVNWTSNTNNDLQYFSIPQTSEVAQKTDIQWVNDYKNLGIVPSLPDQLEITIPETETYEETVSTPWNEPMTEPYVAPQPMYIQNPNLDTSLVYSSTNPYWVPNPLHDPSNPMPDDPTMAIGFDPIYPEGKTPPPSMSIPNIDVGNCGVSSPTKPSSSWDLLGWLIYLAHWVSYAVIAISCLVAQLGTSLGGMMEGFIGFFAVIGSFFSFLPEQLVTVLIIGAIVGILLRVFGR